MFRALVAIACIGSSPFVVPPPNNSAPVGIAAYGSGTCVGADSVLWDNNGGSGCPKLTDVAPQGLMLRAQPAFPGGTQTAASVLLCGGQDETTIGIDGADPTVTCAGANDTVTVTVVDSNGLSTATVLTGDVNWTVTASVATTCANLATAVDALAGVTATCTSPNVRIVLDSNTCKVTLAESTAACTTVGVGTASPIDAQRRITNSGGELNLGTLATTGHALGAGDVHIGGTGEIDGTLWCDGQLVVANQTTFQNTALINSGINLAFGATAGTNTLMTWATSQTPDALAISVGTTSRGIVVVEAGDNGTDFAHALQTNPTLFIQSSDATNVAQWVSEAHNQTDAIHGVGSGDHGFADDGGKGVVTYLRTATQSLTFAGGGGDASKTTSGLVPDGAMLLGITTRVTTTATTCATVNIGDGTDVDMFGAATGVSQNTTTTNADATAQFGRSPATAAMEVTVTGNGANCVSGVWAVTAHYIQPAAATSN